MLFRRHNPTPVALPVALIAPPADEDTRQPPHYALNPFTRTPKTLEEILSISAKLPTGSKHATSSSSKDHELTDNTKARHWPQYRVTREPSSRKTGHATIHTDATDQHEAFESDAFAVHMPTTRLPILDRPLRSTKPSPAAQAEAYQTYKEKARQMRERNNSSGVQIPSKIVSYDYASPSRTQRTPIVKEVSQPLGSPSPAGSFPISPPLPQAGWARPERVKPTLVRPRDAGVTSKTYTSHKSNGLGCSSVESTVTYRKFHHDAEAGATCSSPSPSQPAPIRVRIKPRVLVTESQRVQTESKASLYSRSSSTASPPTSRSPSPVKSMPNFTRHNSVEGDSLFGYRSKDRTGTVAGAASSSGSDKEKDTKKTAEAPKKVITKRTLASRWPWLRPAGPRVAKPVLPPIAMSNIEPRTSAYVDPFVRHALPTAPTPAVLRSPAASRPASPRKTARATTPAPHGEFETGFAQIKQLTYLLCKVGFALYAIIALWFILDAVREAMHTIGAPFRLMKFLGGFLWIGLIWLAQFCLRMWERWGFKVALRGGWMWKMRWWQV